MGFTNNVERSFPQIRNQFPYPDKLRSFRARFSHAMLIVLVDRVTDDMDELEAEGIDIHTVGVSVPSNVVDIRVASADASTVSTLGRRYGANRVRVTKGPPMVPLDESETPVDVVAFGVAAGLLMAFAAAHLQWRRRRSRGKTQLR